jgi:hypothetical protein
MSPLTPDKSRSAVVSCSLLVARCSFALFLIVLTGGCANNGGRESVPTLNPVPTVPSPAPVPAGNNFVWISKTGYEPVGRPAVTSCDNCNQIVEMNGDTRLDIELARR